MKIRRQEAENHDKQEKKRMKDGRMMSGGRRGIKKRTARRTR